MANGKIVKVAKVLLPSPPSELRLKMAMTANK